MIVIIWWAGGHTPSAADDGVGYASDLTESAVDVAVSGVQVVTRKVQWMKLLCGVHVISRRVQRMKLCVWGAGGHTASAADDAVW